LMRVGEPSEPASRLAQDVDPLRRHGRELSGETLQLLDLVETLAGGDAGPGVEFTWREQLSMSGLRPAARVGTPDLRVMRSLNDGQDSLQQLDQAMSAQRGELGFGQFGTPVGTRPIRNIDFRSPLRRGCFFSRDLNP
jgi:hypothetical protein